MFALADCNNFYASCERAFNPALIGRPVIILSNNDGCVVARSNEVKDLGIKMGVPFYQIKEEVEKHGIAVFSSNYTLYGDMSRRVMMMLRDLSPRIWVYSIDECFLDLKGLGSNQELHQRGIEMARKVHKGTGIPITIGMAETKTLAKMASRYGKRYTGYQGCCMIETEEQMEKALKGFPIEDVWGIGRRSTEKLTYFGIKTAWDFTQKSEGFVRRLMGIQGVRTWKELQGISCISVEEPLEKKTICTSRSFKDKGLCRLEDLEEAIASFTASCSEKLKAQHSVCATLMVFAWTSPFKKEAPSHYLQETIRLDVPSNSLRELTGAALKALRKGYAGERYLYKKAGVIVQDISADSAIQTSLFDGVDRRRLSDLEKAIDEINHRNGYRAVRLGVSIGDEGYRLKREFISSHYTTDLDEILKVKA